VQFIVIKQNAAGRAALLALFILAVACESALADECSTAIITSAASVEARPILWKNRDTGHLSNAVVFVNETPYSYLGLVDADDASGRRVWVGLNSAGFAIMNTVAYNLPKNSEEAADLEGVIMADALRLCATVGDFERYIKENTGRALGSQANFGVIDASGGAAVLEVHNEGYKRLDAAAAPEKYLLITNFSRTGEKDKGRGYVRFQRLEDLFKQDNDGKYTIDEVLETFARDLENPLLARPEPLISENLPEDARYFINTQHTIDRGSTAAAVAIEGVGAGQKPKDAIMWVILGEPVTGIAVPLWVETGEVPAELGAVRAAPVDTGAALAQANAAAAKAGAAAAPAQLEGPPINRECMRLKGEMRPWKDDERAEYLDLSKLENRADTGWLPVLLKKERDIFDRTTAFLATNPDKAKKAAFQKQMAAEALQTLKSIR
jgi:hypothetical protein